MMPHEPKTREEWETRIAEIKARLQSATRGPWKSCDAKDAFENWPVCPSVGADDDGINWAVSTDGIHASEMDRGGAKEDAEFIANSRQDIPFLIDSIMSLQAKVVTTRNDNQELHRQLCSANNALERLQTEQDLAKDALQSEVESLRSLLNPKPRIPTTLHKNDSGSRCPTCDGTHEHYHGYDERGEVPGKYDGSDWVEKARQAK